MESVVAGYPENIQSSLDARVEPTLDQAPDILVDVLSGLAEMLADLLQCEAQERSRRSGRKIGNHARLPINGSDISRHVGMRRRSSGSQWVDESLLMPDRDRLTMIAGTHMELGEFGEKALELAGCHGLHRAEERLATVYPAGRAIEGARFKGRGDVVGHL